MPSHRAVQGECLQAIARQHGFSDAGAIWNHDKNKGLRERRASMNVLAPGDEIYIPEPATKKASASTGAHHRFVVELPRRDVHVVLIDAEDKAIAGLDYVLRVGTEERRGKTNGQGAVHETGFHPAIDRGLLEVPALGLKRELLIGHLDPHHDDSGWRQRLVNLGYSGDDVGLAAFAKEAKLALDADPASVRDALHGHGKR